MIDNQWGTYPILFQLGEFSIPSYPVLILTAILIGGTVYFLLAKKANNFSEKSFLIVFTALMGGAIGSKLPVWLMNYQAIIASFPDLTPVLTGRTILGGMIGGTLAVYWYKRKSGIKLRIGNQLAPAIALGMAIGRIGCFMRGCCFGIPTHTSYGINFGDGIKRHPTQIYDALFNLGMFIYLLIFYRKVKEPGKLFAIYINIYFIFRFGLEFFREEPIVFWTLTAAQTAIIFALCFNLGRIIFNKLKSKGDHNNERRLL